MGWPCEMHGGLAECDWKTATNCVWTKLHKLKGVWLEMLHKLQQVKCGSHRIYVCLFILLKMLVTAYCCRSRWPRGIRRGSEVGRLLELRVRISPETWMSVFCECCVLSGRGLASGWSFVQPRPKCSYTNVVFLSEMFLLWNLIFEHFSKICQEYSIFIKIGKNKGYVTWRSIDIFDTSISS